MNCTDPMVATNSDTEEPSEDPPGPFKRARIQFLQRTDRRDPFYEATEFFIKGPRKLPSYRSLYPITPSENIRLRNHPTTLQKPKSQPTLQNRQSSSQNHLKSIYTAHH